VNSGRPPRDRDLWQRTQRLVERGREAAATAAELADEVAATYEQLAEQRGSQDYRDRAAKARAAAEAARRFAAQERAVSAGEESPT
jgi:ABC-type transporter Mla subunit MlaD